ncbi:MAG: 1-acyl-sn-glycerol-3-phosphate acyltransferase [Bacilli bacterium]|jgi:1-acyl-sn-glycerol-3-phosphate acyltransferase|nr:1-acyl-sn-glycerol-3-phosphate acyltransferase [Bacilli bacterium]
MKKHELTIEEKLFKRKYRRPSRFLNFLYHFISWHAILKKYHPHIVIKDDINDCKGPCFLIWNHLSRIDHAYLIQAAYPKRMNIVAGYNEFYRSHLQFVFHLMHILPKRNYAKDVLGIKAIMSIVKEGGCVAFSPEGMSSIYGTNQPIVVGTGHLLKHFDIPVYFLKMRGEYLANTKVCLDERIGKCEAEMSLLFTPEELNKLTNEEVEDKINLAFKNDDYEYGHQQHVKWKTNGRICEHLNDICYRCPKCGEELKMVASGNEIKCTACGNGAKMNDYYEFEPFDEKCVIPSSPSKWLAEERIQAIKEIRKDPNYSYSVKAKVGFLPKDHYIKNQETSEIRGDGIFTIDHQGVHFKGTKDGQPYSFDQDYRDVFSLVIVTDLTRFALYINQEYVELRPEIPAVGKLLVLTEEMHRLHANIWKAFPWDRYMYEEAEAK